MKKYLPWIAAIGFTASLVVVVPSVFAQTQIKTKTPMSGAPGVIGTVSAVNGSTITVTRKMRPGEKEDATSTLVVYSVDASGAKIYKNGATSSIGSILPNDIVMVQGAVSGTQVSATLIRDGKFMRGGGDKRGGFAPHIAPSFPIQGNGQPIIAGKLTLINGNALTVTTASNIIYAVDATNAKFVKNGTSTPMSSALVGESVIVQGAVNGTSVVATSIIVQGSVISSSTPTRGPPERFGFFNGIGNFFKHLFGF